MRDTPAAPRPWDLERFTEEFFAGAPRYKLVETLGRGGMGVIYKAEDTELGETIAIKVLCAPWSVPGDDAVLISRFKQEILLNRKIRHPNVVKLYEFGASGPFPFFTMEFVAGRDLEDVVRHSGALAPHRVASICRQIALGVAAAHDLGIVHRDLKSSNVMIEGSDAVAVLDFGLALLTENETRLTSDSKMMGTPSYISPEQATGQRADKRSDVYSIGVIAYELLTGSLPFEGTSPYEVALKHVTTPVPPALVGRGDVPDLLKSIVHRCLRKDPDGRFPSARELEIALADVRTDSSPGELPVIAPVAPRAASAPKERADTVQLPSRPVVLVVDDDELLLQLFAIAFPAFGFDTLLATNGQQALEVLERERVDVVLLDAWMPEMDGFDTMWALKSRRSCRDLAIVLMSANLTRDQVAFATRLGARAVLEKPLVPNLVAARLREVLEARSRTAVDRARE